MRWSAWLLYRCARLRDAVKGASTTQKPMELFLKRMEFLPSPGFESRVIYPTMLEATYKPIPFIPCSSSVLSSALNNVINHTHFINNAFPLHKRDTNHIDLFSELQQNEFSDWKKSAHI